MLQSLRNLGPTRLAAIGGVLAATIGFFVFISSRLATPNYGLLYSDLDTRDSGEIVQKLEALNVPYQLKADGAQILVPNDQVARLRIAMAEGGLPHGASVGYEIFDKSETLGTSNFVQNMNSLRALEGELARTITSIGAVQGARVHLVLGKRELFSRDKQEPSASIVLKTRGAISKGQVAAIQHLVAAAVPGLRPGRISIVDNEGNLLARASDDGADPMLGGATAEEMQTNYENRLAGRIEEMLERSLGAGKVRAEVHADLDNDHQTTTQESFDPDGVVVRSTQTSNETSDSSEGGDQPVTVANNLPDAQANKQQASSGPRAKTGKTEETTNNEIGKTVKTVVRVGGVVKRLSVAVLVDGTYTTAADGTKTYAPRPPEELKQFEALVKNAVGFDQKRGDSVEVANLRFVTPDEPALAASDGIMGFSKSELIHAAEPLALGIVGLLALLLVVRPIVTRILEAPAGGGGGVPALAAPEGQRLLAPPSMGVAGALPAPSGAIAAGVPATASAAGGGLDSLEQMIDINQVEGRVRASSIKKIGEIVDKHPEEAVAIVRSWMYQNA